MKHFNKQKDRLGIAAVYGALGSFYYKLEEYQQSIEYYNNAYDIYNELNQIQEKITCLKGIGNALIKLENYDQACDIFLECSAVCSDHNDIYSLLDCLGQLIQIHEIQEKWDVVYELYKKSLKAFKELSDHRGMITAYFNMGIIKKKFNDYLEAERYFKKGTNIAIDSNFVELILRGLSYVGEVLVYQGEMKQAMMTYIKALDLAQNINAQNSIIQLTVLLKSLGLNDEKITSELVNYRMSKKI